MIPKVFISPLRRSASFQSTDETEVCMQVCKTLDATADEYFSLNGLKIKRRAEIKL
jgi:hypothetical protein